MINRRREREAVFSLPRLFRCRTALSALALLLLLPSFAPAASRRPSFKLLKTIDLPRVGLRINIMPDTHEAPLAPPSVFTYEFSDGATSGKVDMYAPRDLWLQGQQAGRWMDEHSNTLTLATVTLPLPKGFPMPHTPKAEYDKTVAGLQAAPTAWTPETLSTWVADFAGAESAKPQEAGKRPATLQDLLAFSIDGQPQRLVYAFRLNRAATGQNKAATTWFVALFDINPGINLEAAIAAIQTDFLPKITTSKAPATPAEGPAKSFQTGLTSKKTARSPEYMASRDQVAASIKNMADWWYVETANYIILSNLKAKHRPMVKELQEDIECLRSAFEQFMPAKAEVKTISVIRIFADSKEYENYIPASMSWSDGIWMADKKELVIRPVDFGNNKQQRAMMIQTVFHEAFHQYIFYAMDQLQSSPWFNEGYATFFMTATIGNRKLEVEENPLRARSLEERLAAGPIDFGEFLHLTYEGFYTKDKTALGQNYALAWGLVYYLRKAAPLEKTAPYAGILDKYVDALWETKDADKATDAAFQGINLDKFQKDFLKFWESKGKRSAASHNKIFKDYNPSAADAP